jgi:predicted Zn-dependent peptidase
MALETAGGIHYPMGDVFDYNGPMQMVSRILYKPEFSPEKVIAAFDEVLDKLSEHPLPSAELEQLKVKMRSDYYSTLEGGLGSHVPRFGLMHYLACFTLFDGEPGLVNTALDGFLGVTREEVHAAAGRVLRPENRAIVLRLPVAKVAQGAAN